MDSLECLANAHAPGSTVSAPSELSAEIDVVFLAELTSRPTSHVGQEVVVLEEKLTRTRDHSTIPLT
jgi:hypothetical protein